MNENKVDKSEFDNSFVEDIQDYLERIKRTREKMDNYDIAKFDNKLKDMEESYKDSDVSFSDKYKDYIEDIKDKINRHNEISKVISEEVEKYNKEFEKLNDLLKEEAAELDKDALLNEDEIRTIREDYLNRKISISTVIIALRDKIEALRRQIAELEAQIERDNKEFEYSASVGITRTEYRELMDKLKSKEIIDTILSAKGVADIVSRDVRDRTPEEKEKLATVRTSIRDEIAKVLASTKNKSVLETIQFLYNIDSKVEQKEPPKSVSIPESDLKNITINITININSNPVKVAGKDQKEYTPQPAPKDMPKKEIDDNMKNVAGIAELKEAIDALEKVINSLKGMEGKEIPTDKIDFEGLASLYKEKKNKLDELIRKSEEKEPVVEIKPEEEKKEEPTEEKKEEPAKKERTANQVYGQYRLLSNRYDALADERIKAAEKYGKHSEEVAKIDAKLKELAVKMQETLDLSHEKLQGELETMTREEINKKYVGTEKGKYKLINDELIEGRETVPGDITTYMINGEEKRPAFTDASAKAEGQIDGSSFKKLPKEKKPKEEVPTGGDTPTGGSDEGMGSEEREPVPTPTEHKERTEEPPTGDDTPTGGDDGMGSEEREPVPTLPDHVARRKDTPTGDEDTPSDGGDDGMGSEEREPVPVLPDHVARREDTPTGEEEEEEEPDFDGIEEEPFENPEYDPERPTPVPTPTPEPDPDEITESEVMARESFTIFLDADNDNKPYVRKATFDRFFAYYGDIEEVRINGALCYAINDEELEYIERNKENNYSPYNVEYVTVHLGKEEEIEEEIEEDIEDKEITLYRDLDDDEQAYASETILKMFNMTPHGDPINIYGSPCYKITPEEDGHINSLAAANENPRMHVRYVDVHLKEDEDVEEEEITLYRAVDEDGQIYATETILKMFNIEPTGESIHIYGDPCYKITPEEDAEINEKADASENPKMHVRYKDVYIKDVKEETVVIYKAVDEDDQLYASKEVFDKFGIPVEGDPTDILGTPCYKVSPEQDAEINEKADASEDPIIHVIYKPIKVKQEEKPKVETHYQEVIRKITKDLDIKKKDGKRYRAANIKVWQTFKDELHAGNYIYNILHFAPAVVKAGMNLIRKIAAKIMLSKRGREVTKEINARLNGKSEKAEYNLTDDDLEVLWQQYKGRNLRADMNNQINPIIIAKLREYGMKKVAKINEEIKQQYLAVIAASDEIDKLKEEIAKMPDGEKKEETKAKLKGLYKFAADAVRVIETKRKEADDLLSNGVHGIEEDFKAVETKMNYIGLRFSKQHNFDNELQDRLADAGKRINTAKANGDDQELFEAFIDYEKIYYENTEVKGSIVGKRSTGKKWYSPHAELMDYRDDPLIRDFFTTAATVAAVVAAANGILTHLIEAQRMKNQINANITSANQANLQYHNAVQTEVGKIQGQHQAEIEGLQAQMYRDVGYRFNTGERGILDQTGWSFNGTYHANDAILHSESQNLITTTQSQISSLAQRASSGALTETQYIDQLASNAGNLSTTVNNALQPLYQASKAYAQGHPFAYDATLVPMEWFAQHPNAFVDLGNAISVINHSADAMALLSPTMMQTIGSLPSDLATTLAAGISSLALVRSAISSAKGKTTAKNSDKRKTTDEGKAFGERIMGEKSDKELEEMMDDDDKEAENEDEKGNSK